MKILPPNLPPQLAALFHLSWSPGAGLDPNGIRALLDRVRVTREQLAAEAGVKPHYVDHVIVRVRRSAMVEGLISQHLAPLGLTQEHIWGPTLPPRNSEVQALHPCLSGQKRFTGRLLKQKHGIGLVVDCETTGLSPDKHALVELGLIAFVFSRAGDKGPQVLGILDAFTGLQDPGGAVIDPFAMRVNKIALKDLYRRRLDHQRINKVVSRAEFVIAHNVAFDFPFVTREVKVLSSLPWFCSMKGVHWKNLGHPSMSLSKLCTTAGIVPGSHRALDDCRALLEMLSVQVVEQETLLSLLLSPAASGAPMMVS